MKVFEFKDGQRGSLLAEVKLVSSLFGRHSSTGKFEDFTWSDFYEFHIGASNQRNAKPTSDLDPAYYGVEAICFCSGQGQNEWNWYVVATPEKVKKWVASGDLIYTPHEFMRVNGVLVDAESLLGKLVNDNPDMAHKVTMGKISREEFVFRALAKMGAKITMAYQGEEEMEVTRPGCSNIQSLQSQADSD